MDSHLQAERNHARRLIKLSNLGRSNELKFTSNETYDHARAKFEVCWVLMQKEMEFYTEAILFNGCRADVYVLDTATVIECLSSETEEQCEQKTARYPQGVNIETARMVNGKLEWKIKGD